ncbi:MAG: hypothetical protein SVZ03_10010 [Spirochaetota bacterium]|nr:hypothetical protein [Spirochaetota bacterium]
MKFPDEESDIYKIRVNGSSLTNLTKTSYVIEGDPSWSSDGESIVYSSFDAITPRFVIKKMDVLGGKIETIYDGGEGVSTPAFPPGNYDPCYSPDGQWIVFERPVEYNGENWGSGIWHIFKINIDGRGLIDLILIGDHSDRAEYLPSFSPDGDFIVFGSFYEADPLPQSHDDIFRIDANGDALTRLTDNPASDKYPVWIP